MGTKITWVGLTIMLALTKFLPSTGVETAGAIIMIIGTILLCLDK